MSDIDAIWEWAEKVRAESISRANELRRIAHEEGWANDYEISRTNGRISLADELLRFLTTLGRPE